MGEGVEKKAAGTDSTAHPPPGKSSCGRDPFSPRPVGGVLSRDTGLYLISRVVGEGNLCEEYNDDVLIWKKGEEAPLRARGQKCMM